MGDDALPAAPGLRVALAVHGYPPELAGGTERHVASFARELSARGHEVLVLAGTLECARERPETAVVDDGIRIVRIRREDLHFERWHRLYHAGVSELIRRELSEFGADVLHVHHWLRLSSDLVRQAHRLGVPAVVTLHDHFAVCPTFNRVLPDGAPCTEQVGRAPCAGCVGSPDFDRPADFEEAFGLRVADLANELALAHRVLALSRDQADRIAGVIEGPLVIEDHPFVVAERPARAGVPDGERRLRVLTLGRVGADKGQDVLLDAVRRTGRSEDIEVHLFGECHDAGFERRLRNMAESLRVRFRGPYDHAMLEREAFDLCVLPSQVPETHGLVLDEAQALGIPAFVSDRGAYRERVGDGGRVFGSGDADALADLLRWAVTERGELRALRDRIPALPRFQEHIEYVLGVYREVQRLPVEREDAFDQARHARWAERWRTIERLRAAASLPGGDQGEGRRTSR